MAYQPIENYGIIGDLHTLALVGMNGSIDWLCCPHFDSPSVFAAILDDKKGGHFKIAPTAEGVTHKQFYWPETNVLITRFLSADGVGEITDYMPVDRSPKGIGQHQVIRRVSAVRGTMTFRMECYPAFNYARDEHQMQVTPDGACFYSQTLSLGLATRVPLKQDGKGVTAEFGLNEGQTATFLLQDVPQGSGCGISLSEQEAAESFKQTVEYWRRWIAKCTYTGRWREVVHRSALALKLLTFKPTGAIVA
ncbi:MAG: trehalase-like domain-containing protein, partial [candidate division NC10 bacterium]